MNQRILWGLACASMIIGIVSVTRSALHARTHMDRISSQGKRLAELNAMQAEAASIQDAVQTVSREIKEPTTGLQELINVYLPEAGLRVQSDESEVLYDGWVLRREKISFDQLPGDALSLFLQKAEAQRPPWRVDQVKLEPGPEDTLSGEVHVHTLQKSGAGS